MKNVKEIITTTKGRLMVAVPAVAATSLSLAPRAYASSAGADVGAQTTEIVGVVKSVMGLFTEFPLNILLVMGIVGGAIGIFARAKKASSPGR